MAAGMGRPLSLLVCSIGNPGPQFANTLHSAGHTVLNALASRLQFSSFRKDRSWGNGLVSKSALNGQQASWTLWQSTSLMNESGKGVKTAYLSWKKQIPTENGLLVVVHDELEKPLGSVTLKTAQGLSAKGHNGLKSIMSSIGNLPFVRIGIGIGRPESRTSADVSKYVLRKMSSAELAAMDGAIDQIISKLQDLESSEL